MEQLVESIISKSKRLVDHRNELLEENKLLKASVMQLKGVISNQELIINELKEKQKVKQLTGVLGKEDKKESVKKIDDVLREVNRCMAVLNA